MTGEPLHPVLVTGATGRVGRAVVAELLGAGVPVRALTRRPDAAGLPAGVEVVAGDLTVPESLDGALQGTSAVFLVWTKEQFLEPMSVLVIAGESRREWKHSIPARAHDVWMGREWPRARRLSLTFRQVLPADQRPNWEPASWAHLRNRLRPPSSSE